MEVKKNSSKIEKIASFAMIGWEHRNNHIKEMLLPMRQAGIKEEQHMFAFTKGVNTHKGMIFTPWNAVWMCRLAAWKKAAELRYQYPVKT